MEGVPLLPTTVPGAAVSPGTSSCNFTNAPALTGIEGLVFAVIDPCVTSEAVTIALPAVLSVMLKIFDPLTNGALVGNAALASLEVIATVSLVLLIRFQLA